MPERLMKIADALRELNTHPVISLWPTAAAILRVSRSEIYAAAKRGDVETLAIGRLRKAISAPLRKKLKMDGTR
jgi:hypothetical protein